MAGRCASEALRRTKAALARAELGRLAVRALGMKVSPSVSADETLDFGAGCAGRRVVYRFAGSR